MNKFPITKFGYEKLKEEVKQLKLERVKVADEISHAREFGDLSENAEYHAAREKQSMLEARIRYLETYLVGSEVIDHTIFTGNAIKFGAKLILEDIESKEIVTYMIVGAYEADVTKKMISVSSPMARQLIGKNKGDIVEVRAPGGEKVYKVLDVNYNSNWLL